MHLRRLIYDRGLNQSKVAAALNLSNATISRWALGRAVVPTEYLHPLAALLQIEVEQLLAITTQLAPNQQPALLKRAS